MTEEHRPTVAEIDLAALRANYHALRAVATHGELMVVVKADGYGHGAVTVARTLGAEGCRNFGVATIDEARELRRADIAARIFLQAGFFAEQAREIVELSLTPFVFDSALIAPLEAAAKSAGTRGRFPIHLKIDTGASRLGVLPANLPAFIDAMRAAPSLHLEGLCTLLANAGDPASPITDRQLSVFRAALETLRAAGFAPIAHVANSAALVLRDDSHFNLVRPGLAIYGLPPVAAVRERVELRPVMTFKTRLMQTKRVPAGSGVGYGHTFIAPRESIIGVLPVGYADGYRRGLQHGGEVLVRGARAPVVGAVSMDLTTIDLTEVPGAAVGDEVILWGQSREAEHGGASISVNDVARLAQTISYEMLCTVGRRVPRICRG